MAGNNSNSSMSLKDVILSYSLAKPLYSELGNILQFLITIIQFLTKNQKDMKQSLDELCQAQTSLSLQPTCFWLASLCCSTAHIMSAAAEK